MPKKRLGFGAVLSLRLLEDLHFRLRSTRWFCGTKEQAYRLAETPYTSSSAANDTMK